MFYLLGGKALRLSTDKWIIKTLGKRWVLAMQLETHFKQSNQIIFPTGEAHDHWKEIIISNWTEMSRNCTWQTLEWNIFMFMFIFIAIAIHSHHTHTNTHILFHVGRTEIKCLGLKTTHWSFLCVIIFIYRERIILLWNVIASWLLYYTRAQIQAKINIKSSLEGWKRYIWTDFLNGKREPTNHIVSFIAMEEKRLSPIC